MSYVIFLKDQSPFRFSGHIVISGNKLVIDNKGTQQVHRADAVIAIVQDGCFEALAKAVGELAAQEAG